MDLIQQTGQENMKVCYLTTLWIIVYISIVYDNSIGNSKGTILILYVKVYVQQHCWSNIECYTIEYQTDDQNMYNFLGRHRHSPRTALLQWGHANSRRSTRTTSHDPGYADNRRLQRADGAGSGYAGSKSWIKMTWMKSMKTQISLNVFVAISGIYFRI